VTRLCRALSVSLSGHCARSPRQEPARVRGLMVPGLQDASWERRRGTGSCPSASPQVQRLLEPPNRSLLSIRMAPIFGLLSSGCRAKTGQTVTADAVNTASLGWTSRSKSP
jgi:hypothetical protein